MIQNDLSTFLESTLKEALDIVSAKFPNIKVTLVRYTPVHTFEPRYDLRVNDESVDVGISGDMLMSLFTIQHAVNVIDEVSSAFIYELKQKGY